MPDTKPDFDIRAFRNALVEWFRREGKDYPWRRTTDPWHILVSELMLQQTTIPTVLGRYERWMRQFPTPGHLASVDEQTALRSWEGLGYYRRVRSLQAIAREIVHEFGGEFPDNPEGLKRLPGIGPYTSGALLSFAFNKAAPIVDANVARVLARIDNYSVPVDSTEGLKYLWTARKIWWIRNMPANSIQPSWNWGRPTAGSARRTACSAPSAPSAPRSSRKCCLSRIPSRKLPGWNTTTFSTSAVNPSCWQDARKGSATPACTVSPSGRTTTPFPCPMC